MRTRLLAILCCLSVLIYPAGSSAHSQVKKDRNDTRGELDLSRVQLSHDSTHLFIRMQTFDAWRLRQLSAPNSLRVWFKRRNSAYFEVRTWHKRGRLRARVHKVVGNGYFARGEARARKTGPRSLLLTVRRAKVRVWRQPVWFVTSSWYRGPCRESVCTDFAPNSGRYHHR